MNLNPAHFETILDLLGSGKIMTPRMIDDGLSNTIPRSTISLYLSILCCRGKVKRLYHGHYQLKETKND